MTADRALQAQARRAGLLISWTDAEGVPREVAPLTLRRLLDALDSTADVAASPTLHVGRVGARLSLPGDLAGRRCRLRPDRSIAWRNGGDEDERATSDAVIETHDNGNAALALPPVPGYYRLEVGDRDIAVAVAPSRCPELRTRCPAPAWGLAAQLYSLRRAGDGGVGDFTALAELAERAGRRGAAALAVSPVHALFAARPQHYGPYSPSNRLFLNALHVDPEHVFGPGAVPGAPAPRGALVDWPAVARRRQAELDALFDRLPMSDPALRRDFDRFRRDGGQALVDHALFEALEADAAVTGDGTGWRDWPAKLRDPRGSAAAGYAERHRDAVARHTFRQWLAARGLADAQRRARAAGMAVGLIADLAVGTAPDGSHAWSRQGEYLVGPTIGAPPDALGPEGQNWGLTALSPHALRATGYRAFIELLRANLAHAGGLRIDHVMGLLRLWLIPEDAPATEGAYLRYPFDDLMALLALEAFRHDAIIVGEDLGTVPEGFRAQLVERGLLGMSVLAFERDGGEFLPARRWRRDAVAFTTTHDLPTLAGWWTGADLDVRRTLGLIDADAHAQARASRRAERARLTARIATDGGVAPDRAGGADADGDAFVDAAIAHVGRSAAPLAIVPLEDLLGLREQPNVPGTTGGHPNWRRRLVASVDVLLDGEASARRLRLLKRARSQAVREPS